MAKNVAAYGSWRSPISSDLIVSDTIGLGAIALDGEDVYWIEARPAEGGRNVIVRRTPDGQTKDLIPPPFSARTHAHEYGGGAYAVADGIVLFTNDADQRVYRLDPGNDPQPLTRAGALRYADGVIDRARGRMICVHEDHTGAGAPTNTIVALELQSVTTPRVLVSGHDFYAAPRLSPDGRLLAWLAWNHPNMPWDRTELWLATLDADGALGPARRLAGGWAESIFQPEWSPNGELYFVSDRSGWWNIYRQRAGAAEPVVEMQAEFGLPQWLFGMSTYAFESGHRIVCSYNQQGLWRLGAIDTASKQLFPLGSPYSDISGMRAAPGRVLFVAASPTEPSAIVDYEPDEHRFQVLRCSSNVDIDAGYISSPEPLAFPTKNGNTAYGIYYAPHNRDYEAPAGERPPLIVECHGGPTAATSSALSLRRAFWTSRGFALLAVNYGGSTGYGRAYRDRLNGCWGVVDVVDCINGARHLVAEGRADGERVAVAGGSAGGYTVLRALTTQTLFRAGASYYGVSDLEALARDTHKFESRYLDRLIGPYPGERELYRQRSPIHHAERLSCPVIFFQGLEDRVVPPDQTERMVAALRAKGLPVAYLAFAGEQHGLRRSENIKAALDAELYFYARVFGFALAEPVTPVAIENLS